MATSDEGDAGESVGWSEFLDAAISVGLSHDEFWRMSLREFYRVIRVRSELLREKKEHALMRTALSTAYLLNVLGDGTYKDFRHVSASDLYKTWTGTAEPEESQETKAKRFNEAHRKLVERDSWT